MQVEFTKEIIKAIRSNLNVDEKRIYAAGFSNVSTSPISFLFLSSSLTFFFSIFKGGGFVGLFHNIIFFASRYPSGHPH